MVLSQPEFFDRRVADDYRYVRCVRQYTQDVFDWLCLIEHAPHDGIINAARNVPERAFVSSSDE